MTVYLTESLSTEKVKMCIHNKITALQEEVLHIVMKNQQLVHKYIASEEMHVSHLFLR
jgi:hypothetical protein